MVMEATAIEVVSLCKQYKRLNRREGLLGSVKDLFTGDYSMVTAVDNLSFSIKEGSIVGFLGANGAGKSTTIKMLVGALAPTSGQIYVNGMVPTADRTKYVKNIGVVFGQRSQLWWDIPVKESFEVLKEIYELDDREFNRNMERFLGFDSFKSILHTPVRSLSLGQRMLADILAAFIHNPRVVFLDEPTIGLDVEVKSQVRELVKELNDTCKTSIILTTHDSRRCRKLV